METVYSGTVLCMSETVPLNQGLCLLFSYHFWLSYKNITFISKAHALTYFLIRLMLIDVLSPQQSFQQRSLLIIHQNYLFSTYYMPGSVLGSGNTAMNKRDKISCSHGNSWECYIPNISDLKYSQLAAWLGKMP